MDNDVDLVSLVAGDYIGRYGRDAVELRGEEKLAARYSGDDDATADWHHIAERAAEILTRSN